MKTKLLRYFKHAALTITVLLTLAVILGLSIGARLNYDTDLAVLDMNNEGPYIFHQNDSSLSINYIKGNRDDGFVVDQKIIHQDDLAGATCFNPFDSTSFFFPVKSEFEIPPSSYNDANSIFAVSDIEGNYTVFRDFLINSKIIDDKLNWTFGNGHLVLVGDFVDRGYFVTQVLWFIYKLEQAAQVAGGKVHFIIGNHELKNLHGNYESATEKYFRVAGILGKQQHELYNQNSLIGKWLLSKNAIERINGNLFVHGGLHPDIQNHEITLDEINHRIRESYGKMYYPKPNQDTLDQLLLSGRTGPCWYRGYFKDDVLTQEQVEQGLIQFNAKAVVVGHTIHSKVKKHFKGKVISIDVRHPEDGQKNWPSGTSEGLLIEGEKYFRVMDDGDTKEI